VPVRHLKLTASRAESRIPLLIPLSTISIGNKSNNIETIQTNKRLKSTKVIVDSPNQNIADVDPPPFKKVLAANRGEIATRIMRACSELGVASAGIYSHEDRFTQHRYKADQAFMLSKNKVRFLKYTFDVNFLKALVMSIFLI